MATKTNEQLIVEKHTRNIRAGYHYWPGQGAEGMPALGDARWTADLILSTWIMAETGRPPENGLEYRTGASDGGFDRLDFKFLPEAAVDPRRSAHRPVHSAQPAGRRA